jgi:hypothetical protein
MKRLLSWERKLLRKIYGAVNEKGQWRIRRNMELYQLYKDLDLVTEIKKRILHWIGHVGRIKESRIPNSYTQSRRAMKNRKTKKVVGRGCRRGYGEDGPQGLAKKGRGEKRMG